MTDWPKEIRRQKRLERLGTNAPRCAACGETDDRIFELHHVAGRRFDKATAVLCRNCHRKVSDDQSDHPRQIAQPPSITERIGHLLLGMADLFALLAEQCRRFATEIFAQLSSEETGA